MLPNMLGPVTAKLGASDACQAYIAAAGKLLGIELLDHVIVSKEGFLSFKQKGLL